MVNSVGNGGFREKAGLGEEEEAESAHDSTEDRIGWAGTKITDGKTCWLYMAIRLSK